MRPSGRAVNEMRQVSLEPGFAKYAEGSCLVRFGDTHVLCAASLAAGCDAVLHCNGERAEMEAVAGAAGPLNDAARARLDAAMARCATPPETIEIAAMSRTLDAIMSHA